MAKENVGKFYEKLAQDAALAEKLNEMDIYSEFTPIEESVN